MINFGKKYNLEDYSIQNAMRLIFYPNNKNFLLVDSIPLAFEDGRI
jgi:hypothetical protein